MINYFFRVLPLLIILGFSFSSEIFAQEQKQEPTYYGGAAGKKLDWAMYYLKKHYVDSTHNDHLAEVALRSILKELDPFSYYQSKEQLEKQQKADEGVQEEGIGIKIYPVEGKAMVTDIIEGGAADKVGLQRGDMIIKVDNQSVIGLRMDTIANRIKGPDSTFVVLQYERNQNRQNVRIRRSPVPFHSVDAAYMLTDDIGYIKVSRFNSLTLPEFNDAFEKLQEQGIASLVLDLRFNLGGVVNASVGLADEFLSDKKLVIYTHSHNTEREEYWTEKKGVFEEGKLVILVNQSTASASEIFTAAMQDWDRAIVIGQSSYGKGLIQQSYLLGDGSAMRITIGRYYTPAGRNVQGPYFQKQDWLLPYLESLPASGYTKDLPVPDKNKYTTRGNRHLLTDVGGITPDIYVTSQSSAYHNQLNNLGLLFGFSIDYSHKNRPQLLKQFLTGEAFDNNEYINQDIGNAFINYANEQVKQKGYAIAIQPEVPKKTLNNLKAWIGAQVWDNETYYAVFNDTDPTVLRAIECIKNDEFKTLGLE